MTSSVRLRRVTFSVWTVMTISRFLKITSAVNPSSTTAMTEKTRTFLRFLDFAISVSYSDTVGGVLFHGKSRSPDAG